jgi:uncharacterized membrane protein YfcA
MDKRKGIKIGAYSFIIASIGAFIIFSGHKDIGFPIVVCGFIGAFIGMLVHYKIMYQLHQDKKKDDL